MASNPIDEDGLIRRAIDGDQDALAKLFQIHRPRLKRMVKLRMDRRLQGRFDASDVLQEAAIDLSKRLPDYVADHKIPFFIWLRLITSQRLAQLHRQHLGTAKRDANMDVSLYRRAWPQASTEYLASQLLGRFTSVSEKAVRAELQIKLQQTLNDMDPDDREVLVLRHFEELSNEETAKVLEINASAASKRYVRALRRLKLALVHDEDNLT
jgi:RNA polymerase sigma-70 factor (ECF subfamily)